jgi:hypothetical protein
MADGDAVSKRKYYLNYPRLQNGIDDSRHELDEDSTFAGQTGYTTCH